MFTWTGNLARFFLLVLVVLASGCSGCDDDEQESDRCAPPALAPGAIARFADGVRFLYDGPCPWRKTCC